METIINTWFHLNQWQQESYILLCLEFIREWVWTGDFSELGNSSALFLRNPYLEISCSALVYSKYFCTSEQLFIHLGVLYVNVLSLPHLIE